MCLIKLFLFLPEMLKLINPYLTIGSAKLEISNDTDSMTTAKNSNTTYRYRYSLDRSSRKFICPQCGKRTFVRYWDNLLGTYLADERAGKCDRSIKCAYHLPPRALGYRNGNLPSDRLPHLQSNPNPQAPHTLEMDTAPFFRHHRENDFYRFLLTLPVDRERLEEVCRLYDLGSTRSGGVIYWQKDLDGKVRTGKIMHYDPLSGKRDKSRPPQWVHRKVSTPASWTLRQCLFGTQLLREDRERKVAVVESEKTAVLLSLFDHSRLWTACGGKMNLREEMIADIARNEIELYPDLDAVAFWQSRLPRLQRLTGKILCIVPWWDCPASRLRAFSPLPPTADPADLLLQRLKGRKQKA